MEPIDSPATHFVAYYLGIFLCVKGSQSLGYRWFLSMLSYIIDVYLEWKGITIHTIFSKILVLERF